MPSIVPGHRVNLHIFLRRVRVVLGAMPNNIAQDHSISLRGRRVQDCAAPWQFAPQGSQDVECFFIGDAHRMIPVVS